MECKYSFNPEKNQKLIKERNISFEEVIFVILEKGILDILEYPNLNKYPDQRIIVIAIDSYVYLVPAIFDEMIFLKTIIPSRKATKKYLGD